mmetsp:Transcript_1346/g.2966  ORF Transcript_1346/g.2966 Transcript_1346/m.2966 type:complete len:272 (+) Transcript_1346:531-1346(+)
MLLHVMRGYRYGRIGWDASHARWCHGRIGIGIRSHGCGGSVSVGSTSTSTMLMLLLRCRLLLLLLLLLLSYHHDALFGTKVLLFTQLTQVWHDFGSSLSQTLRSLGVCFLIPHVKPNGILIRISFTGLLVFVGPCQESSRRIHLTPQLYHFPRHLGFIHLGGREVTQFVFVDEFPKLDIPRVVVGTTAPSQQDVVVAQLGDVLRGVFGVAIPESSSSSSRKSRRRVVLAVTVVAAVVAVVHDQCLFRIGDLMNRSGMIAVRQRASHVLSFS